MSEDKNTCCGCGCSSHDEGSCCGGDSAPAQPQGQKLAVKRQGIISEFWGFMKENKAYWMAPIIIVSLLLVGLLVLATISPAAATFIYTTF